MNRAGILTNLGWGGVGGTVGDGAARGHGVAQRVRLLGGQHPGYQGGDHRVVQVSRPPAGSPCPARPGAESLCIHSFHPWLCERLFSVLVSQAPRCGSSETPCPVAGGDD